MVNMKSYAFFWVTPLRPNSICRRFRMLCLFHLHRLVGAYENETECSGTLAYNIQTQGNYPEESIHHSQHGESLKSEL